MTEPQEIEIGDIGDIFCEDEPDVLPEKPEKEQKYVKYDSPAAREIAACAARGTYQKELLDGFQCPNGTTLTDEQKAHAQSYERSRSSVYIRLRKLGLFVQIFDGVLHIGSQPAAVEVETEPIVLTEDQEMAVEAIRDWTTGHEREFGLFGFAGTGKTTALQYALQDFRGAVAMAAPTHRAVAVLAEAADRSGLTSRTYVEFATLHSLCAAREVTERERVLFRPDPDKRSRLRDFDLVVLDEASMISTELLSWIDEGVSGRRTKILYVGDPGQLPPIDDPEGSPVFQLPQVRLTEVIRNQGVIQDAATHARSDEENPCALDASDEHGEIRIMSREEWLKELLHYIDRPDVRALAYRNKVVDATNGWLRRKKFGAKARPFEPGERLVVVTGGHSTNAEILRAETTMLVTSAELTRVRNTDCWLIDAVTDVGRHSALVLDRGQQLAYDWELNRLLREAKSKRSKTTWDDFHAYRRTFLKVRPFWCTTIHKSQGSTYDKVFIVQRDVTQCTKRDAELRSKLLYVAYSRAKSGIYIT